MLAGVGNALLAQPMVRQLKRSYPEACLGIFARTAGIAAVFDRIEEVDDIEVFGNAPREFPRLIARIRAFHADLCAIPYPSNRWQYSLLAALCGARRVLLNRYGVGSWRAMHFLPGERVPVLEGAHDLVQALNLLRPLGIEPDATMAPVFPLESTEIDRARAVLPAGEVVAIHAGSGATVFGQAKRWLPENYARLIDRLRGETTLTPLLIEGPDEAGVSSEIRAARPVDSIRLAGPLRDAAALLAACRLYVGNDSGLAHLAAAVGTPPVTLFGPARPDELCPWGYRHLVVQTPAPCAPCFAYPTRATTPRVRCRPPYCVNQIQIDSVIHAIRRALADGRPVLPHAHFAKTAASAPLPATSSSSSSSTVPGRA